MTQTIATQEGAYLEAFRASLRTNGAHREPSWLGALRQSAMDRFMELRFPTARRGNEPWKYTDIRPLAATPFPMPAASGVAPTRQEVRLATFGEDAWHTLVFVDGRSAPALSSLKGLPQGVLVTGLAEAIASSEELVRPHLGRYAPCQDEAFVALNTAFLHSGAFVSIPDNAMVEQPIHLVFITTKGQEAAFHPRVLIVTGRDSSATVVESYLGAEGSRYFANVVVEAALGRGSALRHYRMQRQSEAAYHICNTQVNLTENSSFTDGNYDFGGGLVRNNLSLLIAEEGTLAQLHGLYMPTGDQHVDNQVIIDYHKGQGTAAEVYKGILNGRARSVFHGSIIVQPNAAKVSATQEDKNLLLSPDCEADTKPAFWIYCDDVKCGHGAACGQIDPNTLFYLRSRGLAEATAKGLMVRGFAAGILDAIRLDPLRGHVNDIVQARLEEWLGQQV
ncbi:MAG: Fe-S cluster assembly protein SufD [Chloroflexi bacterium]|nr:Fe-S cluster assembly protein SufD [Chloroflexota bacterium]